MKGSFRKPELGSVEKVEVVDPLTIKLNPQGAVLAAARPAHRPRRHDGLAQGGRSGGRQVRPASGLRRALQVRRAGRSRTASWSRSSPTTGTRTISSSTRSPTCRSSIGTVRLANLQVRRPRPDRARAGDRHQGGARQSQAQAQQGGVAGLCRPHHEPRQRSQGRQSARPRIARVRAGLRARRSTARPSTRSCSTASSCRATSGSARRISTISKAFPIPKRDVAKAKALLKEAGVTGPLTLDFMVPNGPENRAVAEVVQSMAAEAGFDLKIRVTEFATSLKQAEDGDYQLFLIGWSGRSDPDGNSYSFQTCKSPQNNSRLLRQGSRRRARRGARQERPGGAARRPTRIVAKKFLAEGLDPLPLPRPGAGRAHRQGRGLQADARRPGAGASA